MREHLHRPASRTAPAPPAPRPFARAGTQSGGQALDRHTQREMGARFGHDFSQVRVHTDSRAAESAEALGAKAYALGSDVVFGAGHYTPGSPETDRLVAHELTHVVQQARSGPGDWGRTSSRADASEREADAFSLQVLAGQSVEVQDAPGAAIARDDDDNKPGVHSSLLPPTLGYNLPTLGGMTDFHLGMGGAGIDYNRDPFHLTSGFNPFNRQLSLGLGVGAPLAPWMMDVNSDMTGMTGGVNSLMNGGGLGPNVGPIGTGLGTLGDIAGSGGGAGFGAGLQGQYTPPSGMDPAQWRVMVGVGGRF